MWSTSHTNYVTAITNFVIIALHEYNIIAFQAEENQKKADRLYELKMRELDQRACELQMAEEACRKAVIQATKDFNLAQVFIFILANISIQFMTRSFVVRPNQEGRKCRSEKVL